MAKNEINLFERFIIMMFGVGVVLLGLYPLSKQYGGLKQFVSIKSRSFERFYKEMGTEVGRARLAEPRQEFSSRRKSQTSSKDAKPINNITNKDREELDSLLDKVWK